MCAKGISYSGEFFVSGLIRQIYGTGFNDKVTVKGVMGAINGGNAIIDLGDGNDHAYLRKGMHSAGGGVSEIDLGNGNNHLDIACFMNAETGGKNIVETGSGKDTIDICGTVQAIGAGSSNTISTGAGDDRICIGKAVVTAAGGTNTFDLGSGNDKMEVKYGMVNQGGFLNVLAESGNNHLRYHCEFKSSDRAKSVFELGDGNDTIHFCKTVSALDSMMLVDLGDGNNQIDFCRGIGAAGSIGEGGIRIEAGDGNDTFTVCYGVYASGNQMIAFDAGDGNNHINIKCGGLNADTNGYVNIDFGSGQDRIDVCGTLDARNSGRIDINTGEGHDSILLNSDIYNSNGRVDIHSGDGNDWVWLNKGMSTHGANAVSSIELGDGHDAVFVGGTISASNGGNNIIDGGAGNDKIYLGANIQAGALDVLGGDGYDTLILEARNAGCFNSQYKSWLSDYANSGELANSGIEAVQISLDSCVNGYKGNLDWVQDMFQNPAFDNIRLELNINKAGSSIHFKDLFSKTDAVFDTLDMSGGCKNTLKINGTFDKNGFDGDSLFIHGDANDSVALSKNDWSHNYSTYTDAASGMTYNVYTNSYDEELMVQTGIKVSFC